MTSELDEIKINVPCEIKRNKLDDDNFEIGFNIIYIHEAIKLYKEDIIMKFNSPRNPMIITKDNKNLELTLPVRLNKDINNY